MSAFANYSYQYDPEPQSDNFPTSELNLPPNHRFNVGFNANYDRFFGNLNVNYTHDAFWTDVLDARYSGPTDPYTLVNGAFGVHFANRKVTTSIKVTNILNQDVQQHVFGDFIKRQVLGELRLSF